MKAALTPHYGSADVLSIVDVAMPALGERDLLVQVHATPVTAGDLRLRSGNFPGITAILGRLMMGIRGPRAPIQGSMYSGRVVKVGASVTRFAVGDAVFGSTGHGAYAEFIAVPEDGSVARKPDRLDHEQAASVPYGAGTALHFLRDVAEVKPGERVLVLGGSGGVGRFAIQVAKHLGAEVTAVGSAGSLDRMRALGADHVVDYRVQDFTTNGQRYDVIFDIGDASSFSHSRASLADGGRYLTLYLTLRVLLQMLRTSLLGGKRALVSLAMPGREATETMGEWMGQGVLDPVVARSFPLDQIAAAHTLAEQGVHGSVVVRPVEARPLRAVG